MYKILSGLFLCLALLSQAANSAPPPLRDEVRQVQEQVRTLDKDVTILKAVTDNRLDAQDKRIGDLGIWTAQQANFMAAISNTTQWVGIGITLLALIAGFGVYFTARDRAVAEARVVAKEEAREAAQQLLETEAASLRAQMSELQQKATDALREIELRTTEVKDKARAFHQIPARALHPIFARPSGKDKDPASESSPDPATVNTIQEASQALKSKPEKEFTSEDHFARGLNEYLAHRFDSALLSFEKALSQAEAESVSPERHIGLMLARAVTLGGLEQKEKAIAAYDEIDQRYRTDDSPALREQIANALLNKGVTLGELGRHEDEITVYDVIDRRYGADGSLTLREQVARALVYKGITLGQLGRSEDEIAIYEQIDQRYGADNNLALREQVAKALVNKGIVLGQLDRSQEAIAIYDQIDQRYGTDNSPILREQVARALLSKGITLAQLDRSEEEIIIYEQIDQRYGADNNPALRDQVSRALVNKGIVLGQLGRSQEAIAIYDQIDQRYSTDNSLILREQVARALNGRAFTRILQAKQDWPTETSRKRIITLALEDLRRSQKQCAEADRAMVLGNLGYALFLSGETDQAEQSTLECLSLGGEDSLHAQRGDAQLHRVEPEDSEYEKLLDRLWNDLHPGSANGEGPKVEPV